MELSVITPVFNDAKNIRNLYLRLCQQQDIKFEWVIINDGSTDDTDPTIKKIIDEHQNEKFTISYITQKNSGAAAARREGAKLSKCDLLMMLDSDDALSDDALKLSLEKIRKNDRVDIVCFDFVLCQSNGEIDSRFQYKPQQWPVTGIEAFSLCIESWGLAGVFLIKKALFLRSYDICDKYISGNHINTDELISRLCMYNARNIQKCDGIYFYYQNENSTTRRVNNRFYKIIFTSIALNNFIVESCNEEMQIKSQRELLHTYRLVSKKYSKWKKHLDNREEWLKAMIAISKKIRFSTLILAEIKAHRIHRVWKQIFMAFLHSKNSTQ